MLIDGWRRVPRGVVVLGFVSLLMDASSELVHALLPLFMVTVLGASTLVVGVIEGIAEATAMVVKVFLSAPAGGDTRPRMTMAKSSQSQVSGCGFFLFLLGSSSNWPTLVTMLMLPALLVVCYRLAKQEEADALAQFGDEYRR